MSRIAGAPVKVVYPPTHRRPEPRSALVVPPDVAAAPAFADVVDLTGDGALTLTAAPGVATGAAMTATGVLSVVPSIGSLTDDFTTADTTKWIGYGTNPTVAAGRLQIAPTLAYASLVSAGVYSLRGSSVSVEVAGTPGPASAVSLEQWLQIADGANYVGMGWASNAGAPLLYLRESVGGAANNTTLAWNATAMRYWRISHTGGAVLFEYSADRVSWTTARTLASWTTNIDSVQVRFTCGNWQAETVTGAALFDNLNTAPPAALTGTVALTGSGQLGLGAVPAAAAPVALTGAGQLSPAGVPTVARPVALTGVGQLGPAGGPRVTAPAALTATGQLGLTVLPATAAPVALTADGALTVPGAPTPAGTPSLSGSGALAVAGVAGGAVSTYRMYANANPPTATTVDSSTVSLGVEFYATSAATLTEIRWWQAATGGNTASRQAALYRVTTGTTGTLVATASSGAPTGTGWQTHTISGGYALTPNTRYRATVLQPGPNGYVATGAYFSGGADETSGPLVVPKAANATGTFQGSFHYASALAYPDGSFNATNYWIDVTVSTSAAYSGTVDLTGTGSLSAGGAAAASDAVPLSGTGQLDLAVTQGGAGIVALAGVGTLTPAPAGLGAAGTGALAATGSLSLAVVPAVAVAVPLAATGQLALTAVPAPAAPITLTATGSLSLSPAGATVTPGPATTVSVGGPERGAMSYTETHYTGTPGGASTVVASDTFTGTTGAAPSAANWTTSLTTGSTATIQANALRLVTGTAGSYNDAARVISTMAAVADVDVTLDVTPSATTESYFDVMLRAPGTSFALGQAGYKFEIASGGGATIQSVAAYTGTTLGTGTVAGFAAGVTVHIDAAVSGSTLTLYAWTGATKPTTPTVQVTNTSITAAGNVGFYLNGGAAAGVANTWTVDNFTASTGGAGTAAGGYAPLTQSGVAAAVAAGQTITFRYFYLERYLGSDTIEAAYLALVDADLAVLRAAGAKAIIRFAYSNVDIETYPYGNPDPPAARVTSHIGQLAPTLNKYADVIEAIEAGFIGIWGEWYYTTNYTSGTDPAAPLTAQNWTDRRAVLTALLSNLDARIFVLVRYAGVKPNYFGQATIPADPTQAGYWRRMGYHDDALSADAGDFGTFATFPWSGWSSLPADAQTFVQSDVAAYPLPWGGEIASNNVTYPTLRAELARFRGSFWNPSDFAGAQAAQGWTAANQSEIRDLLGYRLRLVSSALFTSAAPGTSSPVTVTIANDGWGTPLRQYGVWVDLVPAGGGAATSTQLTADPRTWARGGQVAVSGQVSMPAAAGAYTVHVRLTDPTAGLASNPAYCLPLVNSGTFDASTGRNALGVTVTVAATSVTGAVPLAGAGQLALVGLPRPVGTPSLTATGQLALGVVPAATGAAQLSTTGTLTVPVRVPAVAGVAGLSSTGTLSGVGAPAFTGAVALAATGTLTPTPAGVGAAGAGALTGSGQLALTGAPRPAVAVPLSSTGTLGFAALPRVGGPAALAATGSLIVSAAGAGTGAVPLNAAAALTLATLVAAQGTGGLTSQATLTISSTGLTAAGSVSLSASGSLAVPTATPAVAGIVAMSTTGTLTPTRVIGTGGVATLSASGSLAVLGGGGSGFVVLTATGSLGLGGAALTVSAGVALVGVGALAMGATPAAGGSAALTGIGSLSLAVVPAPAGGVGLTSTGVLAVAGAPRPVGAVTLTATGALLGAAIAQVGSTATGQLTLGIVPSPAQLVTLSAAGLLVLSALRPALLAGAALTGTGALSVTGTRVTVAGAAVTLTAFGMLGMAAIPVLTGLGAFTGTGLLSLVGVAFGQVVHRPDFGRTRRVGGTTTRPGPGRTARGVTGITRRPDDGRTYPT